MPMYYPDLKSVKRFAEQMKQQPNESKRYKGLVPTNDQELPEARKRGSSTAASLTAGLYA